MKRPIVSIIGRPNVGKSSIFNRIIGKGKAIVYNTPGVTRDRNYEEVEHEGRKFILVDTGGFDPTAEDGIFSVLKRQVEIAISESDCLLVVMDGREGPCAIDEDIWDLVRKSGRMHFLVVNKIDEPNHQSLVADFYRFGAEEVFPVSAVNGAGIAELLDVVVRDFDIEPEESEKEAKGEIRIAIVGRPNVGKSTLANALIGEERFLTSDKPGTTIDAVDTILVKDNKRFVLVDTAGIRRRKNVEITLEKLSVSRALSAIDRSHVSILVLDATEGVTDQDKKLAQTILERNRGLVIALNKWDLLEPSPDLGDKYREHIKAEFSFARYAPYIFISALKGKNIKKILPTVERVFSNLFLRIPTHELNQFFEDVVKSHPPNISGTKTASVLYLTQVGINPPTILLFLKGKGKISDQYLRFIENNLRERFGFDGVPIRLVPRRK